VAPGGALAAAAIDVGSTKRQNPVALLDARGPELRQLRLRATIGGWERASRRTERRGVGGWGPFGHWESTVFTPSPSIVRRYMCATLLRPTSNGGRHSKAGVGASADCNRKQRECGAFPHPSALASGLVKPPGYPSRSMSTCCAIRPDTPWRPVGWIPDVSSTSSATPASPTRFDTRQYRPNRLRTSGAHESGMAMASPRRD
jgi:hypothetical protein